MDVRCKTCSKLFRIADEKITGRGIRFKCSQCGEVITVLKEDLARESAPAASSTPPSFEPQPSGNIQQPDTRTDLAGDMQETSSQPRKYQPEEYQPKEYQPPAPQVGLEDFDFSEPHTAAQSGSQEEGGQAFTLEIPPAAGESAGEIALSEEEAKESEAAFVFPADIISEPKRKPAFAASDENETTIDAKTDFAAHESKTEEYPLESKPAETSSPDVQTAAASEPSLSEDAEVDLGQALAIPQVAETASGSDDSSVSEDLSSDTSAAQAQTLQKRDVHPLAAGNATGGLAGLGCALPVVFLLWLGFGLMVKFVPMLAVFPMLHMVFAAAGGIVSMGIMIGLLISAVQAGAGKKLFFLLNMLIGTLFGAGFGAGMSLLLSIASGRGINTPALVSSVIGSAVFALFVSAAVVIARRFMLHTRQETTSAPLSGVQKAGLALSSLLILGSLYAEGTLSGKMESATMNAMQQIAPKEITPDGLTIADAQGKVDEKTGDIVITGFVVNNLAAPKEGWYLEADIYDRDRKVIATISMVNGVQRFTVRQYELLAKRGDNVDELKNKLMMSFSPEAIPPGGRVQFEMRLPDPPAGASAFLPTFKKFNLSALLEDAVGQAR